MIIEHGHISMPAHSVIVIANVLVGRPAIARDLVGQLMVRVQRLKSLHALGVQVQRAATTHVDVFFAEHVEVRRAEVGA